MKTNISAKKVILTIFAILFLVPILLLPAPLFSLGEAGTEEQSNLWLQFYNPKQKIDAMCGLGFGSPQDIGFPFSGILIEPSGCQSNLYLHLLGLPANLLLYSLIVFGIPKLIRKKKRLKEKTPRI